MTLKILLKSLKFCSLPNNLNNVDFLLKLPKSTFCVRKTVRVSTAGHILPKYREWGKGRGVYVNGGFGGGGVFFPGWFFFFPDTLVLERLGVCL